MEKLRYHVTVACISFTANILFLLFFGLGSINWSDQMSNTSLFQIFLMHVAISLCLFFMDMLKSFGKIADELLRIFATLLIVLTFGRAFNLFPLDFVTVMIISAMVVIIYAIVAFTTFVKNQSDALRINKKLKENNHE